MKFGDIVINEWAGNRNPEKVLMVVHHDGKKVSCLSLEGKRVVFASDKDLKLRHVAEVDFSKWKTIANNYNQSPNAKSTPCPHADIIAAYTKWFPEGPEVRIWNQYDQGRLQQRWDEDPNRKTLKWWEKYFAYASQSEFLTGRKTSFRATLSWLVGVQNMAKVLNGQYHPVK